MRIDRLGPLAAVTLALASPAPAEEPVRVLAAGSLTGAMTAVIDSYRKKTGASVEADFGPAGLLLERIEQGERVDVFASANMAHPRKLADAGRATPPVVMARNRMCATALPGFGLTSANLLDRLLDPKVGIGTSTPKADPGGDYAWLVFERADRVRPGAAALLEARAQQVVGGRHNPPVPAGRNAMDYFFDQHKVDVAIGYCSSHDLKPNPKFVSVEMPAELAVTADYGMSVIGAAGHAREAALRFALFVMSPEAQHLIGLYGFEPVAEARGAL